jgi:hypothetical protein
LIEKAMSRICRPATVIRTTRLVHTVCAPSRAAPAGDLSCSPATAVTGAGAGTGATAGAGGDTGAEGGAAGGGGAEGGAAGGGGALHVIDFVTVPVSPLENCALTVTVNGPAGATYGTVSVPLTGLGGTVKLSFTAGTPLTAIS